MATQSFVGIEIFDLFCSCNLDPMTIYEWS